ncbi:MAG: recombinase family protein [Dehalococcoidia bacterium]|nr:recombinase family protein [Dehalococcoidia bacterium]
MFEEFVAGVGISRIAKGLNDEAVPAFGGGHWHPLTIRRILLNETYTGRTVYRRTRAVYHRDPATGKKIRRVTERESADWIEVPDATPSIVATNLFLRAQGDV